MVVAVVAAVVVVALAITVPLLLTGDDEDEAGTDGGPTSSSTEGTGSTGATEEAEPTLDDVRTFRDLKTDHVTDDVEYSSTPPAGGEHDPAWLDCGVYDEPVRDENAVHDLEHGTVWITYAPDLPAEDVDALASVLPENGIMSPYEGLPAPVVVTVWERQLALTGADDPRLPLFLSEFSAGETAPEPFASCAGGITP
ncbi:hypothetical protein GCM10023340_10640 [Nocardioides marinquilinus]|uniref:DUF3105 domain-containing protein n=1 Tax=Nocardioides marinquilinus TaxID=1210400 RepID=A0ABP9PBH6_9ACTN